MKQLKLMANCNIPYPLLISFIRVCDVTDRTNTQQKLQTAQGEHDHAKGLGSCHILILVIVVRIPTE